MDDENASARDRTDAVRNDATTAPLDPPRSGVAARVLRALASGAAVYLIAGATSRGIAQRFETAPIVRQWVFDFVLVASALVVWRMGGRPWSELGLRKPRARSIRWSRYAAACATMMAVSALAVMFGVSHPMVKTMSPLQIFVSVWFVGSFAEEIFVRGFVQSQIYAPIGYQRAIGHADVVASSLAFAAMHVWLFWSGMGPTGACIVLAASVVVGAIVALVRRETGSIVHCIGIHSAANASGAIFASLVAALR